MPVSIEQIRPGAVFRFKTAARRVTSLSKPLGAGFNVNWEYADRLPRAGKRTGSAGPVEPPSSGDGFYPGVGGSSA